MLQNIYILFANLDSAHAQFACVAEAKFLGMFRKKYQTPTCEEFYPSAEGLVSKYNNVIICLYEITQKKNIHPPPRWCLKIANVTF